MRPVDWEAVLSAAGIAQRKYLASLAARRVYPDATPQEVLAAVDAPLPDSPTPAEEVVTQLASAVEPYVAAHASGRFFGFVVGGLHPAALGAELLVSTWDQNAGLYGVTPGVAMVEQVAARWLLELLDLPADAGVGFVTGGQMATFTCLAAARDHVLREIGWDVEADGLQGAPRVNVVTKEQRHSTVPRALRFLGLGERGAVSVACDAQDRMDVAALHAALDELSGPTIVCVEAGNVNTGSFDRFGQIAHVVDAYRSRGNPVWVHADGAVGLLARAAADTRALANGLERCDSWSTDGHKALNVAYDSGIAITAHPAAHRAAMGVRASYLVHSADDGPRDPLNFNPEFSRRARGVGVYAVLASLGRHGVEQLVTQLCANARRFADLLSDSGRAEICNDVVFNQVVVRWLDPSIVGEDAEDLYQDRVIAAIQRDGTAFFSGTTWHGRRRMRISVSDWATDADDVDRCVAALLRCAEAAAG